MDLSIVIPAFNEEKLLPATLAAVQSAGAALSATGLTWETIVCDNNSTDRTAEIARNAGARVVFEPQNQISRARNAGAAIATGTWLLFLDADCTVSHELFADLAGALRDDKVLYGGSAVKLDEPSRMGRFMINCWQCVAVRKRWAAGSFLFVRHEAFTSTGGFSPELYAGEELDFSKRLARLARQRGMRFAFLTAHPLVTSARKFRFHSGWGILLFFVRTGFSGMRNLRKRDACAIWYDGQR